MHDAKNFSCKSTKIKYLIFIYFSLLWVDWNPQQNLVTKQREKRADTLTNKQKKLVTTKMRTETILSTLSARSSINNEEMSTNATAEPEEGIFQRVHVATECDTRSRFKLVLTIIPWENCPSPHSALPLLDILQVSDNKPTQPHPEWEVLPRWKA